MATYALTDLHGHLNIYKQIKAFLKPEDTVYFLGDAGDRGPEPWETIKAIAGDSQFIYLKGNHEEMLAEALRDYQSDHFGQWFANLAQNGGWETFDQATKSEHIGSWIKLLSDLPEYKMYESKSGAIMLLCHAGLTPQLVGNRISLNDVLWDRKHFSDKWPEETRKDMIVVHGHTNIFYIQHLWGIPREKRETGALWYCDNHKICLDTATYDTGYAILFDLDTFDEHYFFEEEEK